MGMPAVRTLYSQSRQVDTPCLGKAPLAAFGRQDKGPVTSSREPSSFQRGDHGMCFLSGYYLRDERHALITSLDTTWAVRLMTGPFILSNTCLHFCNLQQNEAPFVSVCSCVHYVLA